MSSNLSGTEQTNTARMWTGILNAKGRFNRTEYAFWSIPSLVLTLILFALLEAYVTDTSWGGTLIGILFIWGFMMIGAVFITATIRRLHDLNSSGWQVLFLFPLGILVVLFLLFMPGKKEVNRWA
ncbi:MAG: DUF805 domain-containing protein [Chloroflexota bacterium]